MATAETIPFAARALYSSLPVWAVIAPMAAGLLLYLPGEKRDKLRKGGALALSFLVFTAVVSLFPAALNGSVELNLEGLTKLGFYFRVDLLSWIFALLISSIWFLATLFSIAYMDYEHNRRRFYSFLVFTLGATLGVVFAGDFLTMFLFFELMTFSSFVLVIHKQDLPAIKAGILYLYMGVAGGLALLFAILLTFVAAGTVEMVPLFEQLGGQRTLIFLLFLLGFGIKAGVVPLHIWLPQAYPVAPAPASALLSGVMAKTGAYGILRVLLVLYSPGEQSGLAYTAQLGYGLLWLGIITMLAGALMALLQSNSKRILAYSSVSQMGYIVTGLGAAAYMGLEGGMGFAGSVYQIINHAFFKAALFMIVGTIYMLTRELDLSRLGGLGRKMPLVMAAFLIAALGMAGIPIFNGYASKTLLHDALLEAHKYYGGWILILVEYLFVVASALTICYLIKLFRGLFLGPAPEGIKSSYRLPLSVQAVLAVFSIVILAIGALPNLALEKLLLPAAASLGFRGYAMEHLAHFDYWEWQHLEAALIVILVALVIYLPGALRGWFNWRPPRWLSIHYLVYSPLTGMAMGLICRGGSTLDYLTNRVYDRSGHTALQWCRYAGNLDGALDRIYERSEEAAKGLADRSMRLDQAVDQVYDQGCSLARRLVSRSGDLDHAVDGIYLQAGRLAQNLAGRTAQLDEALDNTYGTAGRLARDLVAGGDSSSGEASQPPDAGLADRGDLQPGLRLEQWTTKNLNFDTLLLVGVLGLIMFIVFYYGR